VHNSRRPLDRLTLTLTFDLVGESKGIVVDYLCSEVLVNDNYNENRKLTKK